MICPKTNYEPKYSILRDTYGKLDVDRDVPNDANSSGHLTNNPMSWEAKKHKITWDGEAIRKNIAAKDR
jgi:hypothetical protein